MMSLVVKHTVYSGGQSVVVGRYITHNDKLCNIEFMGATQDADDTIQRLKSNGSEFQYCKIHEAAKVVSGNT